MREKALVSFLLSVVVLFTFFSEVLGVNVSINKHPQEIGSNEFEVTVLVEGASVGNNYLRVDFFQEGTTKYFGETFNGNDWYGGSSGTEYFPIEISKDSSTSATFKGRVGDPSYSKYPAPGDYLLRIRRYTSLTSYGSDIQDPVKVKINIPVNTPTPEVQSTATEEEDSDTPKPTPTPRSTKKPTPKPVRTPTPTQTPEEEKVLALDDERENEENNIVEDQGEDNERSKKSLPLASIFLLVVGVLMLSYGGFYVFRELRIKYKKKDEEKAK